MPLPPHPTPPDPHAELDNPVWHALTQLHTPLARGTGQARRYPDSVSPLTGLQITAPQAFADLAPLAGNATIALFSTTPTQVPTPWHLIRELTIDQMICLAEPPRPAHTPRQLTPTDVPEMLALTKLTEPGPFLQDTIQMGQYFGIHAPDGTLAAMAGERLRLNHFTEISAVCTHPSHRGQRYAQSLVAFLAHKIRSESKTPFLHLKSTNTPAKKAYEKAAFTFRRPIHVTVITQAPSFQNSPAVHGPPTQPQRH